MCNTCNPSGACIMASGPSDCLMKKLQERNRRTIFGGPVGLPVEFKEILEPFQPTVQDWAEVREELKALRENQKQQSEEIMDIGGGVKWIVEKISNLFK